ncbi:hypothetical protein BKA80DRAFT_133930 [Phyllosticta citrichinensis]
MMGVVRERVFSSLPPARGSALVLHLCWALLLMHVWAARQCESESGWWVNVRARGMVCLWGDTINNNNNNNNNNRREMSDE